MPQSITSILNQPVRYLQATDECLCSEDIQCLLAIANQSIYSQLKISPCGTFAAPNNSLGDELVCNGDFNLGSELVTNGTFTGSATGWTLGTNWAYETNDVRATAAAAGQTLSQTIASLVTGKMYLVQYTVSDIAAGNVRVSLGGTTGATAIINGSYSELIVCGAGNTISFERVSLDFSGDIDNVSVKLLDCWDATAGRTWDSGSLCLFGAGVLSQDIAAITTGDIYQLVFTIDNFVTGTLTPSVGGTSGASVNADGIYIQYITAGATTLLEFTEAGPWDGCISSISLKKLTSYWDADEIDWHINATGACHDTGNTTDLLYDSASFTSGKYYHITITVSSSTAGGINVVLGTTVLTPQSSGNGVFHFWGESDGTTLKIRPTSTFDGCISALTVEEYCNEYEFHILDEDGVFVEDITHLYDLEEDVFNLSGFKFNSFLNSVGASDSLPFGCYKFCLVDCCADQQTAASLLQNYNFSSGGDFWTPSNATFSAGTATLNSDFGVNAHIEQALITTGSARCINITFDFNNHPAVTSTIAIYINGTMEDIEPLSAGAGTYTHTFENVPAGAVIRFEYSTGGGAGNISLDNIIVIIEPGCQPIYDQCTPCITYQESFNCTKLIEASCEGNAYGFAFDNSSGNNQFKLSFRAVAALVHSKYEQEQEDYDYSDGNSSLSFGQNKKFQSLAFDPIPEYKHDTVALQKICDTFQIDSVDYFVKKGDYTPEWNRNDLTDLAPSRIDVKKKDQTLYNTNCS